MERQIEKHDDGGGDGCGPALSERHHRMEAVSESLRDPARRRGDLRELHRYSQPEETSNFTGVILVMAREGGRDVTDLKRLQRRAHRRAQEKRGPADRSARNWSIGEANEARAKRRRLWGMRESRDESPGERSSSEDLTFAARASSQTVTTKRRLRQRQNRKLGCA